MVNVYGGVTEIEFQTALDHLYTSRQKHTLTWKLEDPDQEVIDGVIHTATRGKINVPGFGMSGKLWVRSWYEVDQNWGVAVDNGGQVLIGGSDWIMSWDEYKEYGFVGNPLDYVLKR